jgi:hypothetical protein
MGLMDKVKAQATVLAQKTQETAREGKARLDQAQANRHADTLLRNLGALVYAEHTNRGTPDSQDQVAKLIAEISAHEAENGINLSTQSVGFPGPGAPSQGAPGGPAGPGSTPYGDQSASTFPPSGFPPSGPAPFADPNAGSTSFPESTGGSTSFPDSTGGSTSFPDSGSGFPPEAGSTPAS